MKFERIENIIFANKNDVIYLMYDPWDDYGYCTTFTAYYHNEDIEDIGVVKIGCKALASRGIRGSSVNNFTSYSIKNLIPLGIQFNSLNELGENFFSLGQDLSYYKNVNALFPDENTDYYNNLNDLAYNFKLFNELYENGEPCVVNSLLRNLHISVVEQYHRVSKGYSELTDYSFSFKYLNEEKINIDVVRKSLPPSNIHVLIGRNGVGKTWLLRNMIINLLDNSSIFVELEQSKKYKISKDFYIDCKKNSFAGIIGLSFSVFDDALSIDIKNEKELPREKVEDFRKKYKYIGLIDKQENGEIRIKSVEDLWKEFLNSLKNIKKNKNKIDTYLETCENLNTDPMFSDNKFIEVLRRYFSKDKFSKSSSNASKKDKLVKRYFEKLSSGHMIIILSLTLLSDSIFEKTIVLIDEPETHLHPPLLSTYIRTLSYLLIKKNAVGIIATHSPIVLQEVPKKCVTKIERNDKHMQFTEVKTETFATSVDTLTREVFGLEVIKTGFYQLIEQELGRNFEESYSNFDENVGFLGQILMQSLLNKKKR
ncbi:AAA family ATPase [Paenibacillus pedocola]|uniref:AAA family ATPase n=1 Tax=Paenibacillus pedocola TaxID=3242193 RepID=UPI00287753B9|nr:AAA family ATPase [Paenibacillus typhae]